MLIGKNICCFPQPFCHDKFYEYMLIDRNAEGVHCQRKFGNLWYMAPFGC